MSKVDEVEKEYQEKLAKAKREDQILEVLPEKPESIYIHCDSSTVTYGKTLHCDFDFARAVKLIQTFKPCIVISEHWKVGCTSCQPREINRYAKDQNAVLDGTSYVELITFAYGSRAEYRDQILTFWASLEGELLKVEIRFFPIHKFQPYFQIKFNSLGDINHRDLQIKDIGADSKRNWESAGASYRVSHYWADVHNWEAWASHELAELEKGKQ